MSTQIRTFDEDCAFCKVVSDDDGFRKSVADLLVTQYADQLRGAAGAAGAAGTPGRDGTNGTSASAASVAEALNDGPFQAKVAELLVTRYAAQQGIPYVHTDNRADNAGMLAINRELGFKPGEVMVVLEKTMTSTPAL